MPNVILTSLSTSTTTLATGDTMFIGVNGAKIRDGGFAITNSTSSSTETAVIVHGSVASLTAASIYLSGTSGLSGSSSGFGGHSVTVGIAGNVGGMNEALYLRGSNNQVVNAGTIISNGDVALLNVGSELSVHNSGYMFGANAGINNFGIEPNERATVTNSGTIASDGNALNLDTNSAYISNSGTISTSGSMNNAISADASGTFGRTLIENSGLISAPGTAISASNDDGITIVNTGHIAGNIVITGTSLDTFDGRGGTISGSVAGGLGDDKYYIDDSGIELIEGSGGGTDAVYSSVSYILEDNFEQLFLTGGDDINGFGNAESNDMGGNIGDNMIFGRGGIDTMFGRQGQDTLYGGSGDDFVYGQDDDDVVHGGDGEDEVYGDDGNDMVAGGSGNDEVFGGNGNDILRGDEGNDRLFGGLGNDTMLGGDGNDVLSGQGGNDVLNGGIGIDQMTGGGGNDVFEFTPENTVGLSTDRINDFTSGADLIDLSALSSGEIDFLTSGGFNATGAGEARAVSISAGTSTRILVDNNGDGVSDFRIDLLGFSSTLTADDFIL